MTVTVNITRAKVYAIAEGVSVTISQHNGGTPTYEQLWASEDEAKKLDIWYREAVSDLERRLMRWVAESSGQFDLEADGDDYTLQLTLHRFWPSRLEGLLDNKIQDYLVHSVTAGWLNDFEGLTVKLDYQAMAAQDVDDIIDIICMKDFAFAEAARSNDSSSKDSADAETGARQSDTSKDGPTLGVEAGYRKRDTAKKLGMDDKPSLAGDRNDRHKDNAAVDTRQDYTDMSGTDILYRMDDPCGKIYRHDNCQQLTRPMMGMGYTPSPKHPPIPEPPTEKIALEPQQYEEPPMHAVPPKFAPAPDYHANGKGWSDEAEYDEESEDRFINSHVCGQHALDDDGELFQPADDNN